MKCNKLNQAQLHSLDILELETIHYRQTGVGKWFLIKAIEEVKKAIGEEKSQC